MTLRNIFKRFRLRMSQTLLLILVEGILAILFPLFIGFAINDALKGVYNGAMLLGGLGLLSLIIGSTRRLMDSRFYSRVYSELGFEVGILEGVSSSKKTARLTMLRELVEFFENSVPQIVHSMMALVGTLFIVLTLNIKIFLGCIIILLVVFVIYALTRGRTILFNEEYNNLLEKQVDVLSIQSKPKLKTHLNDLMKWNIKLSDLETVNFSVVWLLMMGFLVISIIWSVEGNEVNYGAVFALVMYVFQYIESIVVLPFFYQQWLRLKEISSRLNQISEN